MNLRRDERISRIHTTQIPGVFSKMAGGTSTNYVISQDDIKRAAWVSQSITKNVLGNLYVNRCCQDVNDTGVYIARYSLWCVLFDFFFYSCFRFNSLNTSLISFSVWILKLLFLISKTQRTLRIYAIHSSSQSEIMRRHHASDESIFFSVSENIRFGWQASVAYKYP